MEKVVATCLMENNTAFIQLLVDSGFPLHDYVDEKLLANLYMRDFDSNVSIIANSMESAPDISCYFAL